jgi:predicted amidohydrolase
VKKRYQLLVWIVLLVSAYLIWAVYGRVHSIRSVFPRYVISNVEQSGSNSGKGNLIALAPYLHTYDFSSKEAYFNMLHYYFSLIRQKKLMNDSTIVVLPEYTGTWLVVADEKKEVYTDTAIAGAMKTMVLSNLVKFGFNYLRSSEVQKSEAAVFRMKAQHMLDIYQSAFSAIAKEFKVTIVAGSIILPEPTVQNGKISINPNGKLYNVSAVFDSGGNVLSPLTFKRYPIEEEKGFTAAATHKELPVYSTPAGKLAVLICADAWYPDNFEKLNQQHAELLAVPCFISGEEVMQGKWRGYTGAPAPADVDKQDSETMTEEQAWIKYSTNRSATITDLKLSTHVFLRGAFWNLGSDGNTMLWKNNSTMLTKTAEAKTGSIVNCWIE